MRPARWLQQGSQLSQKSLDELDAKTRPGLAEGPVPPPASGPAARISPPRERYPLSLAVARPYRGRTK